MTRFHPPNDFSGLTQQAQKEDLYAKLLEQLNKDLQFANLSEQFSENTSPEKLQRDLHELVYRLISEKFGDYLNLLYIIDVSEAQIRSLDGSDVVRLSEQVAFLILKREWQKVWFKNRL
ncbi:hypothetical protein [Robertkochia aurantiaca]|uniref:hypothetical protein n=1 Tax=Robertkochia aurantiaca TaxID=2873700 RepID=UPI001CCE38E8|nr:hypothetical protein [Robertkochia sp. 3YJGBD-33]